MQGLAVGYGGVPPLLHNLDAELAPGWLVCLLGRNGSGKSTLLRTLGGLLPPLSGTVRIHHRHLSEFSHSQLARHLAMVLPERPAVELLRVRDLVALGRYPYTDWSGRLRPKDVAVVEQAMRQTGIETLAERSLATLSDGECQRAMIARALSQEPEILLLDEPTAHLDLPGRIEILHLLRRLAGESGAGEGRTILLSTHDLDLALRLADRFWLLDAGHLQQGVPEDLLLNGALGSVFGLGPPEGESLMAYGDLHRTEVRAKVCVQGEGPALRWTRQALEREGFKVEGQSASGAAANVDAVVEVAGPPYRWTVGIGAESERLNSIEALLLRLGEGCGPN
jgi:iron complex transport system ATP-binding protein